MSSEPNSLVESAQVALAKAYLGQTSWHITITDLSLDMYIRGQKLLIAHMNSQNRLIINLTTFAMMLAGFIATSFVTSNYDERTSREFLSILFIMGCLIVLTVIIRGRFLQRTIYNSAAPGSTQVKIGSNGILVENDEFLQFVSWRSVVRFFKDERGFFLITKFVTVIAVPEAAMDHILGRDEMVAFIEGKISVAATECTAV
jgi:hypothetical protein